jgi:hypothetical protein
LAQGVDLNCGVGLHAPKTKYSEKIPSTAEILHLIPEMQEVKLVLLPYSRQHILLITSYSIELKKI